MCCCDGLELLLGLSCVLTETVHMELSLQQSTQYYEVWIMSTTACLFVCPFVLQRDWSAGINGVRPLYYSTVMQLGLVEKGAGVLPSLLVGADASAWAVLWLCCCVVLRHTLVLHCTNVFWHIAL